VLYTATKFGVVGMSEAMHQELAPQGIGVSVLCPGPVATGIVGRTLQAQPKVDIQLTPEQIHAVTERLKATNQYLQQGVSPDAVGELVLAAMMANQLYVHTTAEVRPMLAARHQAIMDALPN
jgi:short-subunit dehydrogenase